MCVTWAPPERGFARPSSAGEGSRFCLGEIAKAAQPDRCCALCKGCIASSQAKLVSACCFLLGSSKLSRGRIPPRSGRERCRVRHLLSRNDTSCRSRCLLSSTSNCCRAWPGRGNFSCSRVWLLSGRECKGAAGRQTRQGNCARL